MGIGLFSFALLLAGCARPSAPPGGEPDRTPPVVVSVQPDTFAMVEAGGRTVRIRFNKRISERPGQGQLRDAVEISPRTGEVRVSHSREGLEVELEGGFRSEAIYRVTVLPRIQDLFNNTMSEPFEYFFSTGPDFEPTAVAGTVVDRITGDPVAGARVRAESATILEETWTHSTVADEDGIFTFRFLPADRYRLTAFEDVNRNREVDPFEPQGVRHAFLRESTDTVLVEIPILEPDTLPAVLTDMEVMDSVTLRLEFDDYLDPGISPEEVEVVLSREQGPSPGVDEVIHHHQWEAREADDDEEPDEPPVRDEAPLPSRSLYAIFDAPLEPGVLYDIEVTGVLNINGVPDGGGSGSVARPEPPEDPDDEEDVSVTNQERSPRQEEGDG